jgi:uncharacterized membrane protein
MTFYLPTWEIVMTIVILFVLLFRVAAVTLIVIRMRRHDSAAQTAIIRTLLDIARERFVKGEITREQFEQIKKDLS